MISEDIWQIWKYWQSLDNSEMSQDREQMYGRSVRMCWEVGGRETGGSDGGSVGPWAGPDQIRIALLSQIIGVVEVINHGLIAVWYKCYNHV